MSTISAMTLGDAIETLGGLVAAAGGEGDEALDVVKDALVSMPLGGWLTESLPDLVNQTEVAVMLGVSKATLIRWREPGSGEHGPHRTYMVPPAMAGSAPVWARADVERFRDEVGRRRAPASS